LAGQNNIRVLHFKMIDQARLAPLEAGPYPVRMNKGCPVTLLGGRLNQALVGMIVIIFNRNDANVHNSNSPYY
jgi:hypothetical protein